MKYLLLLIFLVVSSNAASSKFTEEMGYETVYKKAFEKAKLENKNLLMIISTKVCPWCRKLERQTLKKEEINNTIQKNFVPLSVDNDLKNFPKKYEAMVVPTIYFVDVKKDSVIKRVLGYKNRKDFKKLLDEVSK